MQDSIDRRFLLIASALLALVGTVYAAPESPGVRLPEKGLTGVIIQWPSNGKAKLPRVQRVIKGSPAEKAGIEIGDIYTHVDGQSLEGLSQDEVMQIIRGNAGSTMRLRVLRYGADKALYFVIPREPEDYIRGLSGDLRRPR